LTNVAESRDLTSLLFAIKNVYKLFLDIVESKYFQRLQKVFWVN